jgi:hypothetical protein
VVLAPGRAPKRTAQGKPPIELTVDAPVATAGSVVDGSVRVRGSAAGVRDVDVALVRRVTPRGERAKDDVVAGPVAPDGHGRFHLRVPAAADEYPSATGGAGGIAWYVRAHADLARARDACVLQEIGVGSGPHASGATEVGFPPRTRISGFGTLFALGVVGLGGLLMWFIDTHPPPSDQPNIPKLNPYVPPRTVPERETTPMDHPIVPPPYTVPDGP